MPIAANAGVVAAESRWLYWNGAAISYLVEILLATTLAWFLVQLVVREWRQRRAYVPTILLMLLNLCLIVGLLATLARTLVAGGWLGYTMPWADTDSFLVLLMPWAVPAGGSAIMILVLFCYIFPQPLPNTRNERRALGILMAGLVIAECGAALRADIALLGREVWWRPGWFGAWMSAAMAWAIVLQWRQLARSFAAQEEVHPADSQSGGRSLGHTLSLIWHRPVNREGVASRGLLIICMLPVVHTLALFLAIDGEIASYPVDLFICWSALFMLTGFALIFLGYLPERSSFLFKLTIIGMALAFAAVSGTAWLVGLGYERQYLPADLPRSGQMFRFTPQGAATYAVVTTTLRELKPEVPRNQAVVNGNRTIELPFAFRFYGRSYHQIHVGELGSVGFVRVPDPSDASFAGGAQPAIFPLLVRSKSLPPKITVQIAHDRAVIERSDRCLPGNVADCYNYQTVLYADGSIEIRLRQVPIAPQYRLFDPLSAPWTTGLVPGWRAVENGKAEPVLRDYYRQFLGAMDGVVRPIVQFTIVVAATVLIGLRVLFRGFLVEPLNSLLAAMRRFRKGHVDLPVPVRYNDEIGYLTESFNEMVRAQADLVDTLEQRVAARTAEVATFAARSAQLEERTRIASDLHDTVSQTMFSAAMLADRYARESEAEGAANDGFRRLAHLNRLALNEMRLLLVAAKDGVVTGEDTADRLTEIAAQFENSGNLNIAVNAFGMGTLPADVAHAFCQIAREALNNVVKHSGARHVDMTADFATDEASMQIADDGAGFDLTAVKPQSLGLQIMHDRARQVNAVLELAKRDGSGMSIVLAWRKPVGE